MNRIRRRLAVHFTYRFFLQGVFIFVILAAVLFLLIQYFTNQDMKKNFPLSALDNISVETTKEDGVLTIPQRWIEQLTEGGYWLQIVDDKGKVVYSVNAPSLLKSSYGANELLQIEETGRYESFRVITMLDTTDQTPLFYMLGVEDSGAVRLKEWNRSLGTQGLIRPTAVKELEQQLERSKEYLEIMDENGRIVQSIGNSTPKKQYRPLELIAMRMEPGIYPNDISINYEPASRNTWILHTTKKGIVFVNQPILHEFIIVLIVTGAVMLLLTFAFSLWHGYRYGEPLQLFVDWFDRMGQGRYDEALTEKERKKVFRKNGKIRLRYRLYKEVIAEFYEMAARLDALEQERRRLESTREEWMTGISHDLRTPLSTIHGYGHLLESSQYEWTGAELQEMGKMIREKGDYMLELLQDFSLTFQLKNNAISFSLENSKLNELVRRVVLRYVNDVTIQHVTFAFEESKEELVVKASVKWFKRMLDNLISNAIKHNPPGTVITVRTETAGDDALIIVEDNGIGMDEETRRNLFERYYRGTHTEDRTDGAGLGMSIAKAISIAHKGGIEVESREGSGTRIVLRFPQTDQGVG
ncbi:HAMP domain-containing histidine kinase [Brevibacillus brevis]|uniref:sensor histidine kinase n=1 Tax=Brevibacillus brevis TaxID=1393 RepID=UPI001F223724|nr:HAMP domain-containing sensor histidine kinase [Brevibacillus brevis]UIO42528.1 HAMP domain-containing histidine kinase [Brevibacillus brevis]